MRLRELSCSLYVVAASLDVLVLAEPCSYDSGARDEDGCATRLNCYSGYSVIVSYAP